jgi:hypothetical protein
MTTALARIESTPANPLHQDQLLGAAVIYAVQQQTPEWLDLRCGRVTASRVKDVMDFTAKGLPTAKREKYMYEIVCERMTGLTAEHFVTNAMMWGAETEKLARDSYEVHTGNEVILSDDGSTDGPNMLFATHPEIEWFAASPDGLVGAEGVLELKCPMPETLVKWHLGQVIPEDMRWQVYAHMACFERTWGDFMGFDPRPKSRYQRFLRRLERDDKKIAEMEAGIRKFLSEVDAIMDELDRLCPGEADAPAKVSAVKEQLRKSVEMPDDESIIRDSDLPAWAREMRNAK